MGYLFKFLVVAAQLVSFTQVANAVPFGSLDRRTNVVAGLVGSAVDMTSGGGGTYPRANLLADGSLIGTYTSVGILIIYSREISIKLGKLPATFLSYKKSSVLILKSHSFLMEIMS